MYKTFANPHELVSSITNPGPNMQSRESVWKGMASIDLSIYKQICQPHTNTNTTNNSPSNNVREALRRLCFFFLDASALLPADPITKYPPLQTRQRKRTRHSVFLSFDWTLS